MKRYLSFILLLALMLSVFSLGYAQVTTYPFVEGFETGQTNGLQVQGWTQILGDYSNYWIANSTNTSYNRTPRNGSFNATIQWESDVWMMREFTLQGGQSYEVEVWARQDTDVAADATIGLYYGTAATIADMTNTIVAQTGVINGGYQQIVGSITPATTGNYWIGIHGITTWDPYYLSIDDFRVRHTPTAPILAISPAGYDFGSLIINTTGSKTFTMMNDGIGTLSVSGISPTTDGFFTVTDAPGFPVTLAANETATFTIQYAPTEAGTHSATFTVTDDTRATTNVIVSGECFDPAISTFPWMEDFANTTFPPAEWARYQGLYPTDTLTPVTYGWSRASNFAGDAGNPSARINIYGTGRKHWLITPPIAIPATGYQLDFDVALTTYSGGNPVDPNQQQDDRFIVLISDDPTMVGAQILREWNNTGSEHVYNGIATQGEFQAIDLSSHVGTKYIGFYGESTASGGDVYLYLDNVRVRETPSNPIFSYTPTAIDYGVTRVNTPIAYQDVTVSNIGAGTLNLTDSDVSIVGTDAAMFEFDPVNLPFALTLGQNGIIPVRYAPTAEGAHSATLRMVYNGANYDVALSGNAVSEIALLESFEGTLFPPLGWNVLNYGGAQEWQRDTTAPRTGVAHAHLRYDSVAHNDWLITPKLAPTATNHTFSFWGTNSSTYYDERFNVLVSTTDIDTTSFTPIATNVGTGASTYMYHEYDLSTFIGQQIFIAIQAISTNQLYLRIDDVGGPDVVVEAPAVPVLVSPVDEATLVSQTPTLTWMPSAGGIPTGYKVYLDTNNPPLTEVADVNTTEYTFTTDLLPETVYYWTVKSYNSVGTSTEATPFSFTTRPEGLVEIGTDTTYNYNTGYPCVYGGYWANAREQYILTADELTAAGAQAGIIRNIRFNVFSPETSAGLPQFTISLGATTATEFANTSFLTGLTQAFTVDSYTPTAGWNEHVFTTPFYWDGVSNIVIQVSHDMLDEELRNARTYYTSTTPTYKAMYYRSDSTAWQSTGTASGRSYNRPNMMLQITEPIAGPPAAPVLLSPADGLTGLPIEGFELKWSADYISGGIPDYFTLFLATDPSTIYDEYSWEVGTNTSFNPVLDDVDFNFVYGQRYYWTVSASNTYGEGVTDPPFSFEIEPDPTVVTYPWTENFDSLASREMPRYWTIIGSHTGNDSRAWIAYNHVNIRYTSEPNAAVVFYHPDFPKDEWMITVPFSMQAGVEYNLSFNVRAPGSSGTPESLKLHWGTEPTVASMTANPALYDNNGAKYVNWTHENAKFVPATTGIYYFGWHAYSPQILNYIAVDDITVSLAAASDLMATEVGGYAFGNVGLAMNQTVSVRNMGTQTQSNYTIYLKEAVTNTVLAQELITDSIAPNELKVHAISWTPTAVGTIGIYAEVVLAGDEVAANNASAPKDRIIFDTNMKFLYVGDPETNWVTTGYPFCTYYNDFVAETIYLGSEIQAQNGTIEYLLYYNNFLTTAQTIPVQIWMQNTDTADLVDGWLPWDNYQLVFDGNIECPIGNNEILIPLDTPFAYTGGNLGIRTSKTWENGWTGSQRWWITENLNYGNRTRFYGLDGEMGSLDHAAPPSVAPGRFVPNITFLMDSTTLVNTLPAPAASVTDTDTGVEVSWELIPYAYSYNVYISEDPYNFGTEPTTVYTNTYTPDTTADKGFYKVTANTYRDYNRARVIMHNLDKRDVKVADEDLIIKPERKARRFTP